MLFRAKWTQAAWSDGRRVLQETRSKRRACRRSALQSALNHGESGCCRDRTVRCGRKESMSFNITVSYDENRFVAVDEEKASASLKRGSACSAERNAARSSFFQWRMCLVMSDGL